MFKQTILRSLLFAACAFVSFQAQALPSFIPHSSFLIPNSSLIPHSSFLVNLTAGTQVSLTLNETFSADEVSVGNSLDFFVRSNVTVNGKVLIAAGATATGWVKKVKTACDGKCSEITITVESVQAVDGQTVNLRSIPHVITVPCCGSNKTNANANIGANVTARVLNDTRIEA